MLNQPLISSSSGDQLPAYTRTDPSTTTKTTTTKTSAAVAMGGEEEKRKKSKKDKKKKSGKKSTATSSKKKLQDVELDHPVAKASGWTELDVMGESPNHKYAITGNESQIVSVKLQPGENCQGEPGSMMYLSPNVQMMVSYMGCWVRKELDENDS
jgi:hypothetical protein